ncbi:hypothetical protein HDU91_001064 [Kappamyces sp. JEL0680]|nr:hypothetical protein HDU91_001064 [Kappamyces sp. JEL0680]
MQNSSGSGLGTSSTGNGAIPLVGKLWGVGSREKTKSWDSSFAQSEQARKTILMNELIGGAAFLACLAMLLYAHYRPQYFNKGVGRLLKALMVSDMMYSTAAIPVILQSDPGWWCKIQGTLVSSAGLSCSFILLFLSFSVFRIVTYRSSVTELSWTFHILPVFAVPMAFSAFVTFSYPDTIKDRSWSNPDDGTVSFCHFRDSNVVDIVWIADIVSVGVSVICYCLCLVHLWKESRDLLDTRQRSSKFRSMTMRLCFVYTIAGLLSFIPHMIYVIMNNNRARQYESGSIPKHDGYHGRDSARWHLISFFDALFSLGSGVVHALCFVLVYHAERIAAPFSRCWARLQRKQKQRDSSRSLDRTPVESVQPDSLHFDVSAETSGAYVSGIVPSHINEPAKEVDTVLEGSESPSLTTTPPRGFSFTKPLKAYFQNMGYRPRPSSEPLSQLPASDLESSTTRSYRSSTTTRSESLSQFESFLFAPAGNQGAT